MNNKHLFKKSKALDYALLSNENTPEHKEMLTLVENILSRLPVLNSHIANFISVWLCSFLTTSKLQSLQQCGRKLN